MMMRIKKYSTFIILTLSFFMTGCAPVLVGSTAVGVSLLHDRRSAATILEDQRIEMSLASRLDADTHLSNRTHINVTSYNRAVLLTGQAETAEAKAHVVAIARRFPEITRVMDELNIDDPATIEDMSDDAYITSKVKLGLFYISLKDFDPTRVKVVTERGIVYLLGLLTEEEASAVLDKVRYVNGVRRVVEEFEYVERRP